MKKIGVRGRLWLRAFHLFFMILWIGAVVSQTVIISFTGHAQTDDGLRAMYVVPDILNTLTAPGFLGTVITGALLSWLTPWGFFKHKWVIYAIVIVVLDLIIARVFGEPAMKRLAVITGAEGVNALQNPEYISTWSRIIIAGTITSLLLISAAFVSVLKPWRKRERVETAG